MNKYQKIAFAAPVTLAVAFLIARVYGFNGLGLAIIVTLVIALLTLPIVWRAIYGLIQLIASTVAFIGHGIGKIGDVIADFAFVRRQRLSTHRVPGWDTLIPAEADQTRASFDDLLQPHPAS